MTTTFYPAAERGSADYGWLKARYSFSFSGWHNPSKVHFGVLRVLNDDTVASGGGFPEHPHDNMEIITIPLEGALQHKDNTGGSGIIRAGDVQVMSAGSGIRHSEFNASQTETVKLLQIWLFSKTENIKPRYDQKNFNPEDRINKWQFIVHPDASIGALQINQDAVFARTTLGKGQKLNYQAHFPGNGFYVFLIGGSIHVNGLPLQERDALGVEGAEEVSIKAEADAEILLIELPMLLP
jgi:quercetin 2,3-dioxygenase